MHTTTYHPVIRNQVYRQAAAGVRLSEREGGKDQRESRWRGEVKKNKEKTFLSSHTPSPFFTSHSTISLSQTHLLCVRRSSGTAPKIKDASVKCASAPWSWDR